MRLLRGSYKIRPFVTVAGIGRRRTGEVHIGIVIEQNALEAAIILHGVIADLGNRIVVAAALARILLGILTGVDVTGRKQLALLEFLAEFSNVNFGH